MSYFKWLVDIGVDGPISIVFEYLGFMDKISLREVDDKLKNIIDKIFKMKMNHVIFTNACYHDVENLVDMAIDDKKIDLNKWNGQAIKCAIDQGNIGIVKRLLKIHRVRKGMEYIINRACRRRYKEVIYAVMNKDSLDIDKVFEKLIGYFIYTDDSKYLLKLVDGHHIKKNILLHQSLYAGKTFLIKEMTRNGMITQIDRYIFELAVKKNNLDAIKLFMEIGINPRFVEGDENNGYPIIDSLRNYNYEITKLLISIPGIDITIFGTLAFDIALYHKQYSICKLILDYGHNKFNYDDIILIIKLIQDNWKSIPVYLKDKKHTLLTIYQV